MAYPTKLVNDGEHVVVSTRTHVKALTTTYTSTTRRFIKRSGLVAKEGRTIPLHRIRGVDFEIGVIDRRWHVSVHAR